MFPNNHSGLEDADSESHKQLMSAFSLRLSQPFSLLPLPSRGLCVCGLSSDAGRGRARARIGGDILEKLLPLLSGLSVYRRLVVLAPPPNQETGLRGKCEQLHICSMLSVIKVSSEADQTEIWKQLNNFVVTCVTPCRGNVCTVRAVVSPLLSRGNRT